MPMNEEQFIIKASRLHYEEEDIQFLKKLAEDGIDWTALYKMAAMHGVSPIIYHALEKHFIGNIVPSEIMAHFKSSYYQTAIRNANLLHFLEDTIKVFGKKIVLLKGMDLALSLYPNIGVRSMCDVDVLVDVENFEELTSLMKNSDEVFLPIYKSKAHEKYSKKGDEYIYPIFSRYGRIEIHKYIPGFSANLKEKARKSAVPVIENTNLYHLKPEYVLLHLCIHVYRHATVFSYLRMYCDINELVRKYQMDIDWDFVIKAILENGWKEKFSWVYSYVNSLFETPFPECIYKDIGIYKNEIPINEILYGISDYKFTKATTSLFKGFDNIYDKLEYGFRSFFPEKKWLYDHYKCQKDSVRIDVLNYYRYFIEYSDLIIKRVFK